MAATNTDPTAPPDHDPGAGTPSAQEPGWRDFARSSSGREKLMRVNCIDAQPETYVVGPEDGLVASARASVLRADRGSQ